MDRLRGSFHELASRGIVPERLGKEDDHFTRVDAASRRTLKHPHGFPGSGSEVTIGIASAFSAGQRTPSTPQVFGERQEGCGARQRRCVPHYADLNAAGGRKWDPPET